MYSKFIRDAAIELCEIRGLFSHDRICESEDEPKVYQWEILAKEIQTFLDIQSALAVATKYMNERREMGCDD